MKLSVASILKEPKSDHWKSIRWKANRLGLNRLWEIISARCHYVLKSAIRMVFLHPFRSILKNMEKRDNLYIDMDGVLVSTDLEGFYPSLKPDALDFVQWAVKSGFRCHYLTCWREKDIHKQFPQLPKFHYCEWKDLKTEAIDFNKPFYWLEDGCTTDEYAVLKLRRKLNSYIYIDPKDEYALTKLMMEAKL